MASRGRPIGKLHQDDIRSKIQASQLVNRLHGHVVGELEMSATQIKAAEILLRKSVPDLAAVTIDGNVGVTVTWPVAPPKIERP